METLLVDNQALPDDTPATTYPPIENLFVLAVQPEGGSLGTAEINHLRELAASDRETRLATLHAFVSRPDTARRFTRGAPQIIRACVGLDLSVRKEVFETLVLAAGVEEFEDPNMKCAWLELVFELELWDQPDLPANRIVKAYLSLFEGDLEKLRAPADNQIQTFFAEIPQEDLLPAMRGIQALIALDKRLDGYFRDQIITIAGRLTAQEAGQLLETMPKGDEGFQEEPDAGLIRELAKRVDEEAAQVLVETILAEPDTKLSRRGYVWALPDVVTQLSEADATDVAGRLIQRLETTSENNIRKSITQSLGKLPGGLNHQQSIDAWDLVEPDIAPLNPNERPTRPDLSTMEYLVGGIAPEAAIEILPRVWDLQDKASALRDNSTMAGLANLASTLAAKIPSDQAATLLEENEMRSGYESLIAKLPHDQAQTYLQQLATIDDHNHFARLTIGLAESPVALSIEQRAVLLGTLLKRIDALDFRQDRQSYRTYQKPLISVLSGLTGDQVVEAAESLMQMSMRQYHDDLRDVSTHVLVSLGSQLPEEAALQVAQLFIDLGRTTDWHESNRMAMHMKMFVDKRPESEGLAYCRLMISALADWGGGGTGLAGNLTLDLVQKHVAVNQSSDLALSLIDEIARQKTRDHLNDGNLAQMQIVLATLLNRIDADTFGDVIGHAVDQIAKAGDEWNLLVTERRFDARKHHFGYVIIRLSQAMEPVADRLPGDTVTRLSNSLLDSFSLGDGGHPVNEKLAGLLRVFARQMPDSQAQAFAQHILEAMPHPSKHTPVCFLIESACLLPGRLDASLIEEFGRLLQSTPDKLTYPRDMTEYAGALRAYVPYSTDEQTLAILDAILAQIEEDQGVKNIMPMATPLEALVDGLSPEGVQEASPAILASMSRMDRTAGLATAGVGLSAAVSRLPPGPMDAMIEQLAPDKHVLVRNAVLDGLAECPPPQPEAILRAVEEHMQKIKLDREVQIATGELRKATEYNLNGNNSLQQFTLHDLYHMMEKATRANDQQNILHAIQVKAGPLGVNQIVPLMESPGIHDTVHGMLLERLQEISGEPLSLWQLIAELD